MVKQNGSGIRSRLKKVFARGKKKTIKKENNSIKDKNQWFSNPIQTPTQTPNNIIIPENRVVEPIYASVNEEKKLKKKKLKKTNNKTKKKKNLTIKI